MNERYYGQDRKEYYRLELEKLRNQVTELRKELQIKKSTLEGTEDQEDTLSYW